MPPAVSASRHIEAASPMPKVVMIYFSRASEINVAEEYNAPFRQQEILAMRSEPGISAVVVSTELAHCDNGLLARG